VSRIDGITAGRNIANPKADEIATAQFVIDPKIEKCKNRGNHYHYRKRRSLSSISNSGIVKIARTRSLRQNQAFRPENSLLSPEPTPIKMDLRVNHAAGET
jgi:hypothetical protein